MTRQPMARPFPQPGPLVGLAYRELQRAAIFAGWQCPLGNRRSQRKSYKPQGFDMMWESWGMPGPRIVEGPYRPQQILPL